jgi:hypothetical protein
VTPRREQTIVKNVIENIAPDQGSEPMGMAARLIPATRMKAMTLRMETRRMVLPGG